MNFKSFIIRFKYLWYLILLVPVFIFRDYTINNELKYISIVSESLHNNTWFTFYNHGNIYADKPPLFFWLIKIVIILTGKFPLWIIGFFSLLPAIGIIAIMDIWVKRAKIIINLLAANLMLLTSTMFLTAALVVRMDMLMLFFIVLSLYTFYKIYKNENLPIEKYLLPIYIFLALFTKGVIGFLCPIGSIAFFLLAKSEMRYFGRYLGWRQWFIFFGLCAGWFLAIYSEGGESYLNNLLFHQTLDRGINSFHHKETWWFYFPRILWTFAPWTLLLIIIYAKGIIENCFKGDLQKFFLIIIIFNLVLLSIISSKLDIYLLPIYPFVIYLGCIILDSAKFKNSLLICMSLYIPSMLLAVACLIILLGRNIIIAQLSLNPSFFEGVLPYLILLILLSSNLITIYLLKKRRINNAIISLSLGLICTLTVASFYLPRVNAYIGYREIAKSALEYKKTDKSICFSGYKLQSFQNLDVYLNDSVSLINTPLDIDSLKHLDYNTIIFISSKELKRNEELKKQLTKYFYRVDSPNCSWFLIDTEGENKELR